MIKKYKVETKNLKKKVKWPQSHLNAPGEYIDKKPVLLLKKTK